MLRSASPLTPKLPGLVGRLKTSCLSLTWNCFGPTVMLSAKTLSTKKMNIAKQCLSASRTLYGKTMPINRLLSSVHQAAGKLTGLKYAHRSPVYLLPTLMPLKNSTTNSTKVSFLMICLLTICLELPKSLSWIERIREKSIYGTRLLTSQLSYRKSLQQIWSPSSEEIQHWKDAEGLCQLMQRSWNS